MVRILLILVLLFSGYAHAQNVYYSDFSATWFNSGIGVSTSGATFMGGVSHQIDAHLLSARGTVSAILFDDELWDIGLLYGRATKGQKFHQSASVGLGVVGGIRRKGGLFSSEPAESIPITPNVPVELKMYWRPVRNFGVGSYFFANLNTEQSLVGVALSIKVGKMW